MYYHRSVFYNASDVHFSVGALRPGTVVCLN